MLPHSQHHKTWCNSRLSQPFPIFEILLHPMASAGSSANSLLLHLLGQNPRDSKCRRDSTWWLVPGQENCCSSLAQLVKLEMLGTVTITRSVLVFLQQPGPIQEFIHHLYVNAASVPGEKISCVLCLMVSWGPFLYVKFSCCCCSCAQQVSRIIESGWRPGWRRPLTAKSTVKPTLLLNIFCLSPNMQQQIVFDADFFSCTCLIQTGICFNSNTVLFQKLSILSSFPFHSYPFPFTRKVSLLKAEE